MPGSAVSCPNPHPQPAHRNPGYQGIEPNAARHDTHGLWSYRSTMRSEIVPGITADSDVAFGAPVIAGTRLPAALVFSQLDAGVGEAELYAEHGLTPDQVRAALRHADGEP